MQKVQLVINKKGFSSVEAVLAMSVLILFVTAFVGAYLYGIQATSYSGNYNRAALYSDEGLEALRNLRDAAYSNLTDTTGSGLATTSNQWNLSGTTDTNDIFTRQVQVGAKDTYRKYATSTVTWNDGTVTPKSVTLVTIFTNWARVVSSIGNWANPNFFVGSYDAAGTNDGIKIKIQGSYAYLIRDGGTPNFLIFNISNPSSPTLAGSLTLSNTLQNIAVSGNYAYITSSSDTAELIIVDITNPSAPSQVGTYDAPGTQDGLGVFYNGSYVFISRANGPQNEFTVINVSTPATPTLVGSVNLNGNGGELVVVGNFAYVTGNNKFTIVNISSPASPTITAQLNISQTASIEAFGTLAIVGAANNLLTIDVSSSTAPVQLGTYAAGGAVNEISLGNSNTYAFIATASATNELQVVNISTPTSLTLVGGFNATSTFNGVAYDPTSDRAFMAGAQDTAELSVIAP